MAARRSHDVFNSFSADAWQQWLAQNGYIVANVNNRGIANYGSAFMKVVYKQLGKWESNDFVETAKYLATMPFVDSTKMAIMGTSYGGYSTTYTLLTHPGVFKVGIANSPGNRLALIRRYLHRTLYGPAERQRSRLQSELGHDLCRQYERPFAAHPFHE